MMKQPGSTCFTKAPPNDHGTLHRNRIAAPVERHENRKRNTGFVVHVRLQAVQNGAGRLHDKYQEACKKANQGPSRQAGKPKIPAAATALPAMPPPLQPLKRGGFTEEQAKKLEEDLENKEEDHKDLVKEVRNVLSAALFDVAGEEGLPLLRHLLDQQVESIEGICDDIARALLQMYKTSQSLPMSGLTRIRGRSMNSLGAEAQQLLARYQKLLEIFEDIETGLEASLKAGAIFFELKSLIENILDLLHALEDSELHDGGRTVAYHVTQVLITSFVSTVSIIAIVCIALGVSFELAAFGGLVGICALPLAFLAPPRGYKGTAMDQAVKDNQQEGKSNSKEYLEAVHKFLQNPSPANLINLNAIKHAG